jgi:hypothetical protein
MLAQELHATAPSGNPRMLRLNEAVAGLVRPGSPSPRPFGSVHRPHPPLRKRTGTVAALDVYSDSDDSRLRGDREWPLNEAQCTHFRGVRVDLGTATIGLEGLGRRRETAAWLMSHPNSYASDSQQTIH